MKYPFVIALFVGFLLFSIAHAQEASVSIENSPPIISSLFPNITMAEESTVLINLSAHVHDPEGDSLAYSIVRRGISMGEAASGRGGFLRSSRRLFRYVV